MVMTRRNARIYGCAATHQRGEDLGMFRFDLTLVGPTPESLEQALAAAARAADLSGRGRLLRWPPPSLAPFFARWGADPEGWWQFNGGVAAAPQRERPRRGGRGHGPHP